MESFVKEIEQIERTPFFLVEKQRIVDSVALIRTSLSRHWSNSVVSYSVKTNSMPCVLRVLSDTETWAEVVSEEEYDLAISCGFSGSDCICNGPAKTSRFIKKAVDSGALLHLDGMSEVRAFFSQVGDSPITFGVRVNVTEPDFPVEALSGGDSSRFGLSVRDGDFDELCRLLSEKKNAKLTSLHLHCNTRHRSKEGFAWLAAFFVRLVRRFQLDSVTTFDIGGSFGHDFDCEEGQQGRWPSWDEYFAAIAKVLSDAGYSPANLRLVIEPGSSLISNAVDYYATLIGRRIYDGIVMMQIDGSRIHVDPHFARVSFANAVTVLGRHDGAESEAAHILCGSTCLEKDRLFLGKEGMRGSVGNRIRISKTGAYTFGMSPLLFIQSAPDVWLRRMDGYIECVHRSKTLSEYKDFIEKE